MIDLIIVAIVFLCVWISPEKTSTESATQTTEYSGELENNSETKIVPEPDQNPERELQLGQSLVQNADGYTTTFSTVNTQYPKTYIEYKQNLGSWAEKEMVVELQQFQLSLADMVLVILQRI